MRLVRYGIRPLNRTKKFTRSQSFKRTLNRVGKANPCLHRSTKVWKFKQKLISFERDLVDLCEV